jgi:hypothetical protein
VILNQTASWVVETISASVGRALSGDVTAAVRITVGIHAMLFLSFCLTPENRLLLSAAWGKLRGLFTRPVLAPGQEQE